ncbi:hypothetical protein KRH_21160 [Kocuria rhizophila DC2201]|uniref:Putative hydro-lyase KRH_21160 n=1 Tax=Kocuria rhizophila (strain ATCC 9341 / DSM 348 / NBRC 103217 / DC2201) TaxID=378753 RepID=Y2116_KOCRD|nr:RecName: Full=Putative hydro-lyase KRH_21160 [Kocuria rhizophila DC2201]BAG30463.1 hypothetical protein KRH_21160 [Kocuria rhizophila DC2201]
MDETTLTPDRARQRFRAGLVRPAAGMAPGHAQANLVIVPRELAFDVLLFAPRNPKPCPVLGVLDAGETTGALLPGGDIRTDVPQYVVYENGVEVARPHDITPYWREDLVTVMLGCSFTFEDALQAHGIRLAHIDQGVNVPMYRTSRRCESAGRLSGPLVVSMRPVPAARVADAVRITSRYPAVHGAPVHVGDPGALGSRTWGHRTSATPCGSPPARFPCSGRAGSRRRPRWWSRLRRSPSPTPRATCSSPTPGTPTTRCPDGARERGGRALVHPCGVRSLPTRQPQPRPAVSRGSPVTPVARRRRLWLAALTRAGRGSRPVRHPGSPAATVPPGPGRRTPAPRAPRRCAPRSGRGTPCRRASRGTPGASSRGPGPCPRAAPVRRRPPPAPGGSAGSRPTWRPRRRSPALPAPRTRCPAVSR